MPDSLDKYQETFFQRLFGKSSYERIEELELENKRLRKEKEEAVRQALSFSLFVRLCLSNGQELKVSDNLRLRQNATDPGTLLFELVEVTPEESWYRGAPEKVIETSQSLIQLVQGVVGEMKDLIEQAMRRTK